MDFRRTLKKVASRVVYYAALILMANGFSFFDLAHVSICWAGVTINVQTTDNLQALVNEYPASTTFSLAPGIHRLQSVVPKNGDSFVGQTGAILSGAALLTTFTHSGSYWTAHINVTQAASYPGQCKVTSPACIYPEDLFFNNVSKIRGPSLSSVGPGDWYLDYSTGTIYMWDDPTGYIVEISKLGYAFAGGASSVTISNLTIEKYACPAQSAAVDGSKGSLYWAVEGNEIRYNHGRGISTGNGMYIYNNNVFNNGNLGIGGGGSNIFIQSNQISYNNFAGYSYYWEAGGAKFAYITNLTLMYNYSHHNVGPGFWNDLNCQYVTYNGNQASNNVEAGIISEISSNITISNNYIWDDGFNPTASSIWYGAGILISTSSNVSVYSNNVSNCMNGIVGIAGNRGEAPDGQPYLLENVSVDSNTITQGTGTAAGVGTDESITTSGVYTTMDNTFLGNTFVLGTPGANYFLWRNEPMPLASFLGFF